MSKLKRNDIIFPDVSYKIIGCAFDVYNNLGSGHIEKYYQRALSKAFQDKGVKHFEQVYYPLYYHGTLIGKNFLDFVVEDKIVVEIKKNERYSKSNIDQVLNYLKMTNMKLAILINFGNNEVKFKRIVNINS
ncbi:MAG TPA: GxxExxY protein [Candidatus Paceibacterota bacterium]|nr:GxxExxY protein [Candidatus Paceibacterota bacterium]